MGREVRRVPKNWKHPKRHLGHGYQPMYDEDFEAAAARWKHDLAEWEATGRAERIAKGTDDMEFWEHEGNPPDRDYYRPKWTDEERTHYQMYETTSEGTPISPVMETPEQLARWLADTNASAFAGQGASYESWLRVCNGGYAPSAVYSPQTGLVSGVEGLPDA